MHLRTFLLSLIIAAAASVLTAQDRTTTSETKQTTVQNPDGSTSSLTVTGEVIRYEPGHTIVIRRSNNTETTYTLDPGVNVPADVQIGRQVTLVTQTQDGTVHIRKITTVSKSPSGMSMNPPGSMDRENPNASAMAPSQSETRETTTETRSTASVAPANAQTAPDTSGQTMPSTGSTSSTSGQSMQTTESTSSKVTTVTGTVRTYEPGQSITIVGPDRKMTTYTISQGVDVPQDVAVGKRVTIETTTVEGKPAIKSVTTKTVKTKTKTVSPR